MTVPGGIGRWLPVVALSVGVVPLGLLAVRLRAGRARRRGVPPNLARRHAVGEVGAVAGTLPWLWMVLTPLPATHEVRLTPLLDIANLLAGDPLVAFFQVAGNLLVFAAFGFCAPLRWRVGPLAVTALAGVGSVASETLQYALALGRVSSVDDVLLNAAGAGLAALAGRRFAAQGQPSAGAGRPIGWG